MPRDSLQEPNYLDCSFIKNVSENNSHDHEFVTVPTFHGRRYSQRIICHLLSLTEAVLILAIAGALLFQPTQILHVDYKIALLGSLSAGSISFFLALASGAASPDHFASRNRLLPSALVSGAFVSLFAYLEGAPWTYVLFCGVAVFVCVYLAKIPALLIHWLLLHFGRTCRYIALVSDDPARRAELFDLLYKRRDVRIVFLGSPSAVTVLQRMSQADNLDEVVLTGHEAREEDIAALAGLDVLLVRVTPQDQVNFCSMGLPWGTPRILGAWNAPAAIISGSPLRGWNAVIKRAMDIAGATTLLILLSPLMIAVAVAIRLEGPGPSLFVQQRVGHRAKDFYMYKFRSMWTDRADANGTQLTRRNDPRVTKVGAFIRRTSIDELPQLFNVLLGNMSLVGPRPHPKGAKAGAVLYDDLIPNFYSRYRMKPGITGLAQVSGQRGNTETEQHLIDRFGSDQRYVEEWTTMLDITILFRTFLHIIHGKNAF